MAKDRKGLTLPSQADLFPNPNNGNFTIMLDSSDDKGIISVYSLSGTKIYKYEFFHNMRIDLGEPSTGLYLYTIKAFDDEVPYNGKIHTEKLILE